MVKAIRKPVDFLVDQVDRVRLGEILGQGGFGVVYNVLEIKSNFVKGPPNKDVGAPANGVAAVAPANGVSVEEDAGAMAIKIVDLGKPAGKQTYAREIKVLKRLGREAWENYLVCSLHDRTLNGSLGYIIFPKLGANLDSFCSKFLDQRMDLDCFRSISYQLCHAMRYLEKKNVSHGDIKLKNVCFVNPLYRHLARARIQDLKPYMCGVRLIDFGQSSLDKPWMDRAQKMHAWSYRAPEQLVRETWTHTTDVWSVAVIMFCLRFGRLLFPERNLSQMERFSAHLYHLADIEIFLGKKFKKVGDYIRQAVQEEGQHVVFSEAMQNQADVENDSVRADLVDLFTRMFDARAARRITFEGVLGHRFFEGLDRNSLPVLGKDLPQHDFLRPQTLHENTEKPWLM